MPGGIRDVQSTVPSYRARIRVLLEGLRVARQAASNPAENLVRDARRDVAAEIGGLVSSYFTGRRRIGQRLARNLVDHGRHTRTSSVRDSNLATTRALVEEVRLRLETPLTDQIDWRFQRHVMSEIRLAFAATRPETVLRRLDGVLVEVQEYSPPGDDITIVRDLDRRFRALIRAYLSRVGPNWWVDRVPSPIRLRAERSMAARHTVAPDGVDFLSFGDYLKIITSPLNWDEVFAAAIGDKANFLAGFTRLNRFRTDVAHSRPLSTAGKLEFRVLAESILPAGRE